MYEDNLIITTVRIKASQLTESKIRGINISEFLRNKLEEEFITLNEIDNEINRLKNLKKKLENTPKMVENDAILDEKEVEFFKKSEEILQKNPNFLKGRCDLYQNTFQKRINPQKFLEFLEKIRRKSEKMG